MFVFICLCFIKFIMTAPTTDIVRLDINRRKSVTLQCPLLATGKSTTANDFVLWFKTSKDKNNEDVELGFTDRYNFNSFTSVEINGLTLTDNDIYKCKTPFELKTIKTFILKPFDSSTSKEKGIEAPTWILIPSPIKQIDSSQEAVLPCRADGDNVKTSAYKLKYNGDVMHELPQAGLILTKPRESDSGLYLCVAENGGGKISHQFKIIVKVHGGASEWSEWEQCDVECGFGVQTRRRKCNDPRPANGGHYCTDSMTDRRRCRERFCSAPRLRKFGFEMTDNNLLLHCHPSGLPTPSVLWKYDGQEMGYTYEFNYKHPTMVIPMTRAQSGSYSCTIRNSEGYFTMYITIEI